MLHNDGEFNKSSSGTEPVVDGSGSGGSIGGEEGEEEESFLGLGWGSVEWAVMLLGIGTTVAAISWMVR